MFGGLERKDTASREGVRRRRRGAEELAGASRARRGCPATKAPPPLHLPPIKKGGGKKKEKRNPQFPLQAPSALLRSLSPKARSGAGATGRGGPVLAAPRPGTVRGGGVSNTERVRTAAYPRAGLAVGTSTREKNPNPPTHPRSPRNGGVQEAGPLLGPADTTAGRTPAFGGFKL